MNEFRNHMRLNRCPHELWRQSDAQRHWKHGRHIQPMDQPSGLGIKAVLLVGVAALAGIIAGVFA